MGIPLAQCSHPSAEFRHETIGCRTVVFSEHVDGQTAASWMAKPRGFCVGRDTRLMRSAIAELIAFQDTTGSLDKVREKARAISNHTGLHFSMNY